MGATYGMSEGQGIAEMDGIMKLAPGRTAEQLAAEVERAFGRSRLRTDAELRAEFERVAEKHGLEFDPGEDDSQ